MLLVEVGTPERRPVLHPHDAPTMKPMPMQDPQQNRERLTGRQEHIRGRTRQRTSHDQQRHTIQRRRRLLRVIVVLDHLPLHPAAARVADPVRRIREDHPRLREHIPTLGVGGVSDHDPVRSHVPHLPGRAVAGVWHRLLGPPRPRVRSRQILQERIHCRPIEPHTQEPWSAAQVSQERPQEVVLPSAGLAGAVARDEVGAGLLVVLTAPSAGYRHHPRAVLPSGDALRGRVPCVAQGPQLLQAAVAGDQLARPLVQHLRFHVPEPVERLAQQIQVVVLRVVGVTPEVV